MERAILEKDLAQVEGHVSQGERHIARQHEIVAQCERQGNAALAREVLDLLIETQALHIAHRDRLRRELDAL